MLTSGRVEIRVVPKDRVFIFEIYDALAEAKTQKMTMCGILLPHEHRRTSM